MFNTSTKVYNESFTNLKINAVGGTMIKSHPKSFFYTTKLDSGIFGYEPKLKFNTGRRRDCGTRYEYIYEEEEIIIIQSMLTGDSMVLCEVVKLKDYLNVE